MKKIKLIGKQLDLFSSILSNEMKLLFSIFKDENYEIKIAGGAVRDILMDIPPHDVDFASTATPTEMKELFMKHNIRLFNKNGESHGTISARLNDKENFEITTLRKDVVTDGRRATVEYTKDWQIDAERRDLTINSLFLDESATIFDHFGGVEDLQNNIIRFVGNSEARIQEDYLRILRYFRFYGRISKYSDNHLDEILKCISQNVSGLEIVSGERIWMELSKIISGNHAPSLLKTMKSVGLFPKMGLSVNENTDLCIEKFEKRFKCLKENDANPATFLASLFLTEHDIEVANLRLKLSNNELFILRYIVKRDNEEMEVKHDDHILDNLKEEFLMWEDKKWIPNSKLIMCQKQWLLAKGRSDLAREYEDWKFPIFPVKGFTLGQAWSIEKRALGEAMYFLKRKWRDSCFTADEGELISEINKKEFLDLKCE